MEDDFTRLNQDEVLNTARDFDLQPSARIGSKFLHIFSQDDRETNACEITFERTFDKENATFLV